jgi:uncharacterized protein (TIGR02271 family)
MAPDNGRNQRRSARRQAVRPPKLERVEERLVPRVERAEAGQVVVTKHVVEEPQTVSVPLSHDEVEVERLALDRPLAPTEEPITTRGNETVVLVIEERLEVRHVPYVVEEIHLRRRTVRADREITEAVRKERVDVEMQGDIDLHHD